MPYFIKTYTALGKQQWYVANETTVGENFAEKWNAHPERAAAFFEWHRHIFADVEQLSELEGSDRITKSLSQAFGNGPVNQVMNAMAEEVSAGRKDRTLSVAPHVGIVTGGAVAKGTTSVPSNTFFGRR